MPDTFQYRFDGRGITVIADALGKDGDVITATIKIDDKPANTVTAPVNYLTRRFFLNWDFNLAPVITPCPLRWITIIPMPHCY